MTKTTLNRRHFLQTTGLVAGLAAASPLLKGCAPVGPASTGGSGSQPVKIGVLLPYTGIYAVLGSSITAAMEMYLDEVGNEAGGRKIELIIEDTEIKPDVAQQKARKLVEQDEVDFLTGIVSSGVLLGLRDYIIANEKLLICSLAGSNLLSRELKTPYIWRTSFTNWMHNWPLGSWAAENVGKSAVLSVPDYAAGEDSLSAFQNSFEAGGGEVLSIQRTPFPNMGDPAPFMAEIADIAPDLVYAFYAGSASATFVKAYDDFGLTGNIPLVGSGFLVEEDVLPAQGAAALAFTAVCTGALLDNPENKAFTAAYTERTGNNADVSAVHGYDTGRVIVDMLNMLEGDTSDVNRMIDSLSGISFKSPRGDFSLDPGPQAPRHHIYLREVQDEGGELFNAIVQDLGETVDPGDNSKG
ncbi:MAG: ABC transporter substrate-binding protein [Caldilineaceae bacterium]|nr:ABC transporter substrate-binding protein [Caldilineaceae bacterium]